MGTGIVGRTPGQAVIPYASATKRTKHIALTVTSAQTITSQSGSGYAYADSTGAWRLVFNLKVTYQSNQQNDTLTISGVQAKYSDSIRQAVTINNIGGAPQAQYAYSDYQSPYGIFFNQGTAAANVILSGDIELESEPTWAAANMEGVVSADVYIAPASASASGLVDTQAQSFAGVKTFTNGISLGNETLSVYDEGTWTPTVLAETGSITTYTSSGKYTKIGNTVHFWVTISISNKGTGSNSIRFTLPFTPSVESPIIGWSGATGYSYIGSVKTDASAAFRKYDWTNPLDNYSYFVSGTFVV